MIYDELLFEKRRWIDVEELKIELEINDGWKHVEIEVWEGWKKRFRWFFICHVETVIYCRELLS